jgi:hypothetical protein
MYIAVSRKGWIVLAMGLGILIALLGINRALAQGIDGSGSLSPAGGSPTETFTYQGRLTEGGIPANGIYDLRFSIYDQETGGTQYGSTTDYPDQTVTAGIFSLNLSVGLMQNVFTGGPRWLQVEVRPGASAGAYTLLVRQPIAPVPYAWGLHPGAVISSANTIHSVAETQLAINPFEIEATTELANNTGLHFLHHWLGYNEIENTTNIGSSTIFVPLHNLTQLFGSSLKLKSLEVCYKVDTASSYIDQTRVYYANASGGRTEIMTDLTNRISTTWTCYTINNTTPVEISGPLLIYFNLYFAGTGGANTITIGQITATLVE